LSRASRLPKSCGPSDTYEHTCSDSTPKKFSGTLQDGFLVYVQCFVRLYRSVPVTRDCGRRYQFGWDEYLFVSCHVVPDGAEKTGWLDIYPSWMMHVSLHDIWLWKAETQSRSIFGECRRYEAAHRLALDPVAQTWGRGIGSRELFMQYLAILGLGLLLAHLPIACLTCRTSYLVHSTPWSPHTFSPLNSPIFPVFLGPSQLRGPNLVPGYYALELLISDLHTINEPNDSTPPSSMIIVGVSNKLECHGQEGTMCLPRRRLSISIILLISDTTPGHALLEIVSPFCRYMPLVPHWLHILYHSG
jgi:hypothetical protein